VLEAKRDFVTLYGLESAFWVGRGRGDDPQVVAYLKESLSDLASFDHAQAQQNDDADAYLRAVDWYRRYLAYFPDDPDSAERNYLLADILFALELFDQASIEYQHTAYAYGGHERAAEAAYAGLLAARRHGETLTPEQLDSWQAGIVAQALGFAEAFPQHEQAVPVLTKVAEDLFAAGEREPAMRVAGLVVTWQPPAASEYEQTAWTVIAHANFELEKYAHAERAYQQLLQFPVADAAAHSEITERIAASVYRQAEQAREAGDDQLAVAEFLRVGTVVPGSTFVHNAMFDAATLLITGAQWEQATGVLEQFRRAYPDHPFNDDVTQKLAVAYQESGRTNAAAIEYERIAALDSVDSEAHREALWQAAELYGAAGASADQRRIYAEIVTQFPEPLAESLEARQKLADLARDADDWADRQKWLNAIVTADAQAGTARTDRSKTLAARASLELAAPVRDAFRAVKLKAPLKDNLKLKKKRMEYALAAYGSIAAYGIGEVTTAATFEIADLYYILSQDLMASARPQDLNEEELEQYDILLEEQAFPFEEQAIDILLMNTARTQDGIYDEWVRRSFARLAELMPGRYAKSERSERLVAIID
jgi:tetratricopeptide (TPR) repeat protein